MSLCHKRPIILSQLNQFLREIDQSVTQTTLVHVKPINSLKCILIAIEYMLSNIILPLG